MSRKLIPTTIYLDPRVKKRLQIIARTRKSTDAEVIREALNVGLHSFKTEVSPSIQGLKNIASEAKKMRSKGPKDLSVNHDKYLWDK